MTDPKISQWASKEPPASQPEIIDASQPEIIDASQPSQPQQEKNFDYYKNAVLENNKKVILDGIKNRNLQKVERDAAQNGSAVWQVFKIIAYGTTELNAVICQTCDAILKYKVETGTSSMHKHLKKCIGDNRKINEFFKTDKELEGTDANLVKEAQVKFTSGTLSSFAINDNENFIQFADVMISIGCKYGKVDARKILYGRKTIAKSTYEEAHEFKAVLIEQLKNSNVIENNYFCLMADIWSSRHTKTSYLQVHVQYITSDWKLKNSILYMDVFDVAHTGVNIKARIHDIIETLDTFPEQTRIVTDCGRNMLVGVAECDNSPCACHRLATTIEHAWANALKEDFVLKELNEGVAKIITTLNHKLDIQVKLIKKIKDSNQTRAWRGLYQKLERILINYELLEEFAKSDKALRSIYRIDKELLKKVVDFIKPIKLCFDDFEKETVPTINMVAPKFHEIQAHFKTSLADSDLAILANSFIDAFQAKFAPLVSEEHYIATMLTPNYRKFKFVEDVRTRNELLNETRDAIRKMLQSIPEPDIADKKPQPKKPKSSKKYGEDSSEEEQEDDYVDELDKYLGMKIKKFDDPLDFWRLHEEELPRLSKIAKSELSKAASSSLSEKAFSVAGKINRSDRSSISPENLPLLLIVSYKNKFYSK